jgi:hypothetical protein
MTRRRIQNVPDQIPLWNYCGVCGAPYYHVPGVWNGTPPNHDRCGEALERWIGHRASPMSDDARRRIYTDLNRAAL